MRDEERNSRLTMLNFTSSKTKKKHLPEWLENLVTIHLTNLIFKIYRELTKLNKNITTSKKMGRASIQTLNQRRHTDAYKHIKYVHYHFICTLRKCISE